MNKKTEKEINLKKVKYIKDIQDLLKSELKIKIDENVKHIKVKKEKFELYTKTFDKDKKPKRKIEVEKILETYKLLQTLLTIDPVWEEIKDED